MKNILLVSIAFPPKNDPECLQTAKYVKYLTKISGIAIDVVTSANPTLFMPVDEKLKSYSKNVRQTIEIPLWENKYVNFLIRKTLPHLLEYPDIRYSFHLQWKKVISQLKNKPDVIYSRSFPLSSTIMALKLKQHFQVPWVMHLSDPWMENPIHSASGKAKKWNETMEKKCFEQADIISCTSKKTIEIYQQKYPKFSKKIKLSPNVFDLDDYVESKMIWSEKLKLVYTGGLVADRSPSYLFKALEILKEKNPAILNEIEIIFAGQLDRQNQAFFDQSTFSCVKHIGLLSFPQALELQRSANMLIVIDTPFKNPKEALFFPSKLLDYILAQRRILAITNDNSTTFDVVEGKYGSCFAHEDSEKIATEIQKAVMAFRNREEKYFQSTSLDLTYSAKTCADQLNTWFHELT